MIGKNISHYKILEKLGEGGMGVVYKAEDTKLKREVAIKFLPRHIATSEGERQRFEVEAQAAGGLNHPNIATIYNIEEVDDETFIVMEYIDGQELRDKIDSGPLPIAEALNISLQIVNGLQAAHEKGVTHRDIKSANIMLTDKGDVKIMDFGLSKVRGGPKLTQDQSTLGTAAYMSPEQSRGDEVDHRSDIFSLGVLLYEMVTGQLPFKGDYELAVTFSILNEDPEPITGLRTGVPMELERIVNKCLEKEPSSRYQHADELAVDLGKIKKELETKDSKSVDSIVVPKKRVNQLSIGVGVVVVLLLSFLGYFLFTDEGETTERIPIVVADFLNETDETELNGLSGMLITSLEQSRRLRVFSRSRMFDVLRQLGKSDIEYIDENIAREICKQTEVNALAIASIRKFDQIYAIDLKIIEPTSGEHLYAAREQGEGKASILEMLDTLSDNVRKGLKEKEQEIEAASQNVADITTTNLEAYHHYFLGEQLMSKIKDREARDEYRKAIALDSTFGLAYYGLAYAIDWETGSSRFARPPIQKALALIHRIPEKERYLVRALNERIEGRGDASIRILKEMERFYPEEREMLYNIGDWSYHAGQYTTAIQYLERVLALDPMSERGLQHLVWTYRDMGRFDRTLTVNERLVPINEDWSIFNIGSVHEAKGNYATAADYYTKVLQSNSTKNDALRVMTRLSNYSGDYSKALEYAKKLVAASGIPNTYSTLAYTQSAMKDFTTALKTCEQGLELFPRSPTLLASVGRIYASMGNYEKAENQFKAMTTADQPKSVRSNGFRELSYFYPYLGKYSEMTKAFDKRIDLVWSEGDTNSTAILTVDKALWAYWGTRNKETVFAEIKKIEDLSNITHYDFRAYLAWLYTDMGDLGQASTIAKEYDDDEWWSILLEARASFIRGNWDTAMSLFKAIGFFREQFEPNYSSYVMALCYFEKGELEEAIREVRNAQNYYSSFHGFIYPKCVYLLGKIYEKKGDNQLAIQNYEKFLDLWKDADPDLPDLIDAKKRLTRLKSVSGKL